MLVKIGTSYVDPAEIAAAEFFAADTLDSDRVLVTMRGGDGVCMSCSMEEFEAAMIQAGVLSAPPAVPALTDAERAAARELISNGFLWVARDKDGKAYAYRHRPRLDGACWDDHEHPAVTVPLGPAFPFVSDEDSEPWDLRELLKTNK